MDHANITYTNVADRAARTAFAQTSSEITALKRSTAALESRFAETGYGGASILTAADGVTSSEVRESAEGIVILNLSFSVTLPSTGYSNFLTLGGGFPKTAVAGAVSFPSAPPAGSVTCVVLPDGQVKIGTNVTTGSGTLDCVATAVWKRR